MTVDKKMKFVGLHVFGFLLLPIYLLPSLVSAWAILSERDFVALAQPLAIAEHWRLACYAALFAVPLVFFKGARWTAALIAAAAATDLVSALSVPFVPTILFIVAFVFMATSMREQAHGGGAGPAPVTRLPNPRLNTP